MAERVLGLDVGTSAVRVVEVALDRPGGRGRSGRGPTVTRVGEVPLPPGAVRDGEVADPTAVGAAIAELWRQTGLRSREVRVGLTGARVVVRVIDMPAMPDEDMAGAIRFSAADHIPIPLDEAVLDHAVLEPAPPGEPGSPPMVRVLVVAAHRSTLDGLVAAVAAGGARAVAVDLVPFALVRALHDPRPASENGSESEDGGVAPPPAPAEAIVSVGAALTTVVVHEAGRPKFVRTVQAGGDMLTAAIADEVGIELDAAEAAKRDETDGRAARIVELRLAAILGEIQSGLAYWMAQAERPLQRIVLSGGGARAGDIAGRLALLVGAPVEWGVVQRLEPPEPAAGAGAWADHTVAAGLALGAVAEGWQIDLCPPVRRSFRLTGEMGRRLAVAAAVVVVVLGGLSARSILALRSERSDLAAQQKKIAKVESEIGQFADLRKLSSDLDAGRKKLQSALAGDVSWTRFLDDFVRHMPSGTWIRSLDVQISPTKPVAPTARPASTTPKAGDDSTSKEEAGDSGTAAPKAGSATAASGTAAGIGSLQVMVTGLDFPDAADWLRKVAANPSLSGVAITGTVTRAGEGTQATVGFTSTATITSAARSDRAARLTKAAL
ncbi:MAG: type IV pilus assembly protein PilM [Actinomycetota bacterium]|jgi:type IV pilus assembly protein PilM